VYGLLGVLSSKPNLSVDYSKTDVEVYMDAVKVMLSEPGINEYTKERPYASLAAAMFTKIDMLEMEKELVEFVKWAKASSQSEEQSWRQSTGQYMRINTEQYMRESKEQFLRKYVNMKKGGGSSLLVTKPNTQVRCHLVPESGRSSLLTSTVSSSGSNKPPGTEFFA
jgi:hypothetical protein